METDSKNNSQVVLYKAEDGKSSLEVNLKEDNIWLIQKQMAELFMKDSDTIQLQSISR